MSQASPPGAPPFERRDPCAPLLLLGKSITDQSEPTTRTLLKVYDQRQTHVVELVGGRIKQISGCQRPLPDAARQLFSLNRPQVQLLEKTDIPPINGAPTAANLLVRGFSSRRDLFDPRQMAERIPATTLQIPEKWWPALKSLSITAPERRFIDQLLRPTPVSLALWKRGLSPNHASALLLALNLLGVFGEKWQKGVLPRLTPADRIIHRAAYLSDEALLDLSPHASIKEVEQAFRKLAGALHPDRTGANQPREIAARYQDAFIKVSDARKRLVESRRKRPVRFTKDEQLARQALAQLNAGHHHLGRRLAIKALAAPISSHLKTALRQALALSQSATG